jgi:hypothetical protein
MKGRDGEGTDLLFATLTAIVAVNALGIYLLFSTPVTPWYNPGASESHYFWVSECAVVNLEHPPSPMLAVCSSGFHSVHPVSSGTGSIPFAESALPAAD